MRGQVQTSDATDRHVLARLVDVETGSCMYKPKFKTVDIAEDSS